MSDLKDQLIKLGYTNPELRDNLRPILNNLTQKTASKPTFKDLSPSRVDAVKKALTEVVLDTMKYLRLKTTGDGGFKMEGDTLSLRFQTNLENLSAKSLSKELSLNDTRIREVADHKFGYDKDWDSIEELMEKGHNKPYHAFVRLESRNEWYTGVWTVEMLRDKGQWIESSLEFGWEGSGAYTPLDRKYKKVASEKFAIEASETSKFPEELIFHALKKAADKIIPKI